MSEKYGLEKIALGIKCIGCLIFVLPYTALYAQTPVLAAEPNSVPTLSPSVTNHSSNADKTSNKSEYATQYERLDYVTASIDLGKKTLKAKNYAKAEQYFQRALDELIDSDDVRIRIDALNVLANSQIKQKKFSLAESHLQQALALNNNSEVKRLLRTKTILATMFSHSSQFGEAVNAYSEALVLAKELNNEQKQASLFYNLARAYEKLDQHSEALENFQKALELHLKLDDTDESIKQYDRIATSMLRLGRFDEALDMAQLGLDKLGLIDNPEYTAKFLILISSIHRMLSQYDEALIFANKALKIREQYTDYDATALALNQTGLIYSRLQQHENAKFFYQKTLALPEGEVANKNVAAALRELASLHLSEEKHEQAISKAKRALELYDKDKNRQGESTVHRLLGRIYLAQDKKALAYSEFKHALAHANANSDTWGEAKALRYMGDIESQQDVDAAMTIYKQSLVKAEEISAYDIQLSLYDAMARSEYERKNFKVAYDHLLKKESLSNKITSIATNKAAARMKVRQETKEKEKEILELKRQSVLDELELTRKTADLSLARKNEEISLLEVERSKYLGLLLFIIFISTAIIAVFLYYRFKLVEKNKNSLDEKNTTLEALNENKDRLFSIIAHDLRSPIGAITSLSELLDTSFDTISEERKKACIHELHKSSKSTHRLLEDMLEWAVAQLRSAAPVPKVHFVHNICHSTIQPLLTLASEKQIEISSDIDEHLDVFVDINMVSTVIRNILSNAIKFTPQEGLISIKAKKTHDGVQITIKDNGVGMDKETLKQLFSYDKSHSTSGTDGERGFGVGLSLSREIIEKNGGKIFVQSELNEGSCFFIILPRPAI